MKLNLKELSNKPIIAKDGKKPYPYQLDGIRMLMKNTRAYLLDDMGLGKTMQTVTAFSSMGAKSVLIICPTSVVHSWEREIHNWSSVPYEVQILKGMKATIEKPVVICSYKLLDSPMIIHQLMKRTWGVLVADEVHFCKNAKLSKTARDKGKRFNRALAIIGKKGLITKSIYFWGLSGTLMPNRPIDLFYLLKFVMPEVIGQYVGWMEYTKKFCNRFKMGTRFNVSGARNINLLKQMLYSSGKIIRREKIHVLKDLPSKTIRTIDCECKSIKEWTKLKSQSMSLANMGIDHEELIEIRKQTGLAKVNFICDYIKEQYLNDTKVIVFAWHREVVETITDKLKCSVPYYGAMTPKEKEQSITDFTKGDAKYFVANMASAGTGLDGLQHASANCIFAELPWTATELHQCTDRLFRIGQKNNVLCDITISKNSVDEYVLNTILRKDENFNSLFNK